jgi:hypothetical protein
VIEVLSSPSQSGCLRRSGARAGTVVGKSIRVGDPPAAIVAEHRAVLVANHSDNTIKRLNTESAWSSASRFAFAVAPRSRQREPYGPRMQLTTT